MVLLFQGVNELKIDTGTKMLVDSQEVAQEFNNFFKNKVTNLAARIKPDRNVDPLEKLREKVKNMKLSFKLKTVSEAQVELVVKKLKNKTSHGFDNISAEILKLGGRAIIGPLTWIINTSITEGSFLPVTLLAKN